MVKQYSILGATKAGEPWKTQHGSMLQTYFLNVEGIDRSVTVMCNRKVDSPPPEGIIWAEAEEGTTKKGGPKLTLRIKQAPQDYHPSDQAPIQFEPTQIIKEREHRDDHIRAQWAIGQAIQLNIARGGGNYLKDDEIEGLASTLFEMVDRVKAGSQKVEESAQFPQATQAQQNPVEASNDLPPAELYDNLGIDLDDEI